MTMCFPVVMALWVVLGQVKVPTWLFNLPPDNLDGVLPGDGLHELPLPHGPPIDNQTEVRIYPTKTPTNNLDKSYENRLFR